MISKSKIKKTTLHLRNKNRGKYDLDALILSSPKLKKYIIKTKFNTESIDFSNPVAVKELNTALLRYYYEIENWNFPKENLCPPIPGRADYIHYVADLLAENNLGKIPKGKKVTCLDIGIGASCIYPIIGVTEYGWQFIGSDIDEKSIASAQKIISANNSLKHMIKFTLQKNPKNIFEGVLEKESQIDLVVCNPPFHSSIEEAQRASKRKIKNLTGEKVTQAKLNFGGINNELVYKGGEFNFIQKMILESKIYSKNCSWFTTLLSKESNLNGLRNSLKKAKVNQIKIIPMGTSNKSTRIIAWSFLSKKELSISQASKWK